MKNRLYLSFGVIALFCLAGWTARAQLQRNSSARQTWEYKSITLTRTIIKPDFSWAEDGKELSGSANMSSKARELGAEGWELVTITPVASQTGEGYTGFTNNLLYWF